MPAGQECLVLMPVMRETGLRADLDPTFIQYIHFENLKKSVHFTQWESLLRFISSYRSVAITASTTILDRGISLDNL